MGGLKNRTKKYHHRILADPHPTYPAEGNTKHPLSTPCHAQGLTGQGGKIHTGTSHRLVRPSTVDKHRAQDA